MFTSISTQVKAGLQGAIAPNPLVVSSQTLLKDAIAKMRDAHPQPVTSQDRNTQESLSLSRCEQVYQEARSSCVLVEEAGKVVGILTEQRVVQLWGEKILSSSPVETLPLSALMDHPVRVLTAADFTDDDVAERLLLQTRQRQLPVVGDRGEILGLITHDTLRECQTWRCAETMADAELTQVKIERSRVQQLRMELKLLETILEVILAGYWDWDIPNNQEYLSPNFKQMFGYTDEELPNSPETWQNLVFEEDLPEVLDTFNRHIQSHGQIPYYCEVRYRHKNGSTVWVICSGQVIEWDEAGNPLRMVGCHIDITRQKQAEIQLQRSKEELERFFLVTLDLLCIADTNGRFLRLNQAWETTLGYSLEELEGQLFLDYVHPNDVAPTLAALSNLESQEKVLAFVNRYRCKDGSYRSIEWYSRPYGNLIYAAARDITERLRVEKRLRKSDAHLRAAQRIAQLGSWEFDTTTQEISWSDEVFCIFGRSPEQGPPSYDELLRLYHPADQVYHDQMVQQAIATGQPYDLECRAYRPDGSLVYIQARGEPIFDGNGNLVQFVGTVLDITSRKQVEAELRQTSAQLEASNRELEAFAYSVSHDLRSPLRAIDGFSQALLEDYGDQFDAAAQDYFNRIRRNVHRMGDLIDDLLRLSRVSRADMLHQPVNLSHLVLEQLEELQAAEPERQVEAIVAPNVIVYADLALMRIVLNNLVQNAWKFTSRHPTARIEFGVQDQNDQPIYFLADDGAGFNMAHVGMLFGVFRRLHDTEEFPGTGIGLATVQRVLHRHGGAIWAEGAVEQGATFYFTLPGSPLPTPRIL